MKRLVVNGCSYTDWYAQGRGHFDLAQRLNIQQAESLTLPGACNTRILRTTLKDSYTTTSPTLYVIGLSFLGRSELPIKLPTEIEGRWLSINNQPWPNVQYDTGWNAALVEQFIDLRFKYQAFSIVDRLEDLMYQILSAVNDLTSRGHQVIVFKQAEDVYEQFLIDPRVNLLNRSVNIVGGLRWCANAWQYDRGVGWNPGDADVPRNLRHPAVGQYHVLNDFLLEYINTNNLL